MVFHPETVTSFGKWTGIICRCAVRWENTKPVKVGELGAKGLADSGDAFGISQTCVSFFSFFFGGGDFCSFLFA